MNKKQFIENVRGLLGNDIDPLGLKKSLENGTDGVEPIGAMSYADTWAFIEGFDEASVAMLFLEGHISKNEMNGEAKSNTPIVPGVHISKGSRHSGRHDRLVENFIISRERED